MHLKALFAAVITTLVITLPILYVTSDRIIIEKNKLLGKIRTKDLSVIAYICRTEVVTDGEYHIVKEHELQKEEQEWRCVYRFTVNEEEYEYIGKPHKIAPNIKLYYPPEHPELAHEETPDTDIKVYLILETLRMAVPITIFLLVYHLVSISTIL